MLVAWGVRVERLGFRRSLGSPAVDPAPRPLYSLWHGFQSDRRYIGAKVALIVLLLVLMGMVR